MVNIIGVLIFSGLVAFQTQRLKMTYYQLGGDQAAMGVATNYGALSLYLDFLNLFLFLLFFMGGGAPLDQDHSIDSKPRRATAGVFRWRLATGSDHPQAAAVEHLQDLVQIVAALQHQAALADDGPRALAARQGRAFFDPVERRFGGPAEDREHRRFAQTRYAIVAPLARRHHAPVERQQPVELAPFKENHGRMGAPRIWRVQAHVSPA